MLVQLDDELVASLDELASAEGVSRSELIRRGTVALLNAAKELEDERRFAEGYAHDPQGDELDAVWDALAIETLKDLPW